VLTRNLIENSIRPSALGKKNWLFIGHPEAGERSAVIYTLLGSCRLHGINIRLFERFVHASASGQNHPDQGVHTGGNGGGTHRREPARLRSYAQISKDVVDISRDTR
jgi:hypothetical protein